MPQLPVQITLHFEEADVSAPTQELGVSLVDELDALADVVESAQLIAELLATGSLPDEDAVARAPRLVNSVLAFASGRIRLLRQAALREVDPRHLRGRHNSRREVELGEDHDVVLLPLLPRRPLRRSRR